jgi:hypothetical protein
MPTVKLLALSRQRLADAAKYAYTLLVPDHVVDHFSEQDGLTHAGAAKKAGLSASLQGHEHIDDLDACFKYLRVG